MDNDNLISHLQEFGIGEDECKAYVGLLTIGPSKASNISNFVNMDRVKGYKILENLKNIGFVSSTFSSPTTYSANNLKKSLNNLVEAKKFDINRLERIMNTIIESYETRKIEDTQIKNPQFSIISGKQNIFARIERMIKEETKEMSIVATYDDLSRMYFTSIPECIKKIQKKGITIKIITEIDKGQNLEIIDKMEIDNLRMVKLPSKGRIVCGSYEALISGHTTEQASLNSLNDSTFLTNSVEFVNNMKCFTEQLWKSGTNAFTNQKVLNS